MKKAQQILLSPRLALAAKMAESGKRIIDVGCDHGFLSVHLMQNGAESVIASDIGAKPLERARETAEKYGFSEKIELRLTDGLSGVTPGEADTVAICGMGGDEMCRIIDECEKHTKSSALFVLQPMTRDETLRKFLAQSGFEVTEERLAAEGERLYCVIAAKKAHETRLCEQNLNLFSEKMKTDGLFINYIEKKLKKYRKIASGQQKAGSINQKTEEILCLLTALQRERSQTN